MVLFHNQVTLLLPQLPEKIQMELGKGTRKKREERRNKDENH
jgi:hypothetical protein